VALPGAWSAAHGRGHVVTIGRDARVDGVTRGRHGSIYHLDTLYGDAVAESGSRPQDGQRWGISGSHAYLVGGHGYVGTALLAGGGAAGFVGTIAYVISGARAERRRRAASGHMPVADSLAAMAAGRRVVLELLPKPGRITLGRPAGAPTPEISWCPARRTVATWALAGVAFLGLVGTHYAGSSPPNFQDSGDAAMAPLPDATPFEPPQVRTLEYLAVASFDPRVVLDHHSLILKDVLAEDLGLFLHEDLLGSVWGVSTVSTDRSPQGELARALIDVADLGSVTCEKAIPALIAHDLSRPRKAKATELTGLPAGWRGMLGADSLGSPAAFVHGCAPGTLVSATVDSGYSDRDVVGPATRSAVAIAHRGLPAFRADTAADATPTPTPKPTGMRR
jgi:hypothetical protein